MPIIRPAIAIIILLMMSLITTAQDETQTCERPFDAASDSDAIVMTIGERQITDAAFANRIRFEQAYNIIKYEIRVSQLTTLAQDNNTDPATLIASDGQIQQINAENEQLAQLGNRVLGEMAGDAVVWDYADAHQVTIDQSMLDDTIDQFFGVTEDTTDDERQALIDSFTNRILTNGVAPDQLTTFFCRQTLYDAVQAVVIEPAVETTYVNADHILLRSEAVAQDIITLIDGGDDFATLAAELSLDVASAEQGGALGWQPAIFFLPNFADAVLDGEVGTILQPVQTDFGWHVIRLNQREVRPVPENLRATIERTQFARWRGAQIDAAAITINPDWQSFLPE